MASIVMDEDQERKMSGTSDMDSFLTRIGDVTIERVNPGRSSKDSAEQAAAAGSNSSANVDDSSDESVVESSDGESPEKRLFPEDDVEVHSEGSGDDMDLDETIDSQIGVRLDPEKQMLDHDDDDDDDLEPVNILDSLPLEGAPIEGQEVTEADLLGKPVDEAEIDEDDVEKMEENRDEDDEGEGSKRLCDSENADSTKKKQKKGDQSESSDTECESKVEKKLSNMRRNIREVMDENQLDEATLAAQRQEMERLRRVQEQQRIIREVQRQIAINRQNHKTQTRVISLLQGNQSGTTISPSSSQVRLPNTVLMKVNNSGPGSGGSGTQTSSSQQQYAQQQHQQRKAIEAARWQKGRSTLPGVQTSISRVPNRSNSANLLQQKIRMMTPSVSISPVVPKREPTDRSEYRDYSDSEMSDPEADDALREKQMHTLRKVSGMPRVQKPAKGKDVVTISSSSESSDDDCIVLSDPSGGEETDNEDDPSNSGMHTNDRYNVPDEHGRVLVNVGHPDTEPDVYLAPQVARIIKPHQIGGIRFLYDNIVESIDRYKTSSGFGCILAHSMGLGKTLQVASFCDVFFRCTTAKTVLCIMPINTLQNWLAEFNMWLPYEANLPPDAQAKPEEPPQVDVKQEIIKEENTNQGEQPRMIPMQSIPEYPPRMPQDNPCAQPIVDNTISHQGYDPLTALQCHAQENIHKDVGGEQNFIPNQQQYHNDMSMNMMYGNHPATAPNFNCDPVKSEMDCHGLPTAPQPGVMYPGNYPCNVMGTDREIKQEYGQTVDQGIKLEGGGGGIIEGTAEGVKKEEDCLGKEPAVEKKEADKVKTPFNVDCPIGQELRPRHFQLHILNDSHKTMAARARVIQEWQKKGGVLLIGYELYRQLSLKKPNKAKRKRGQAFKDMVDVEEDDKNKGLLEDMHSALVSPGPDLVICDEGHRIKNSHASISLALKQMRTKRRIVLTGYPLQNNLLEYWCMVDFVRPNYLGTKSEFCNMFERPIQNGQCIDSTPQDIRLMRYRAHVLHALLEGFVQRRSHSVLQISLPRKEEYILLVRMTPHQRKLYDTFMTQVVKTRAVPNPLKAFAVCCKIWNHPDVLYHFLKKRQANEEDDLDLEETIGEKPAPGNKRTKARQPKGESKKGKKGNNATPKSKPAASVQPNSSSNSSNDNLEGENRNQNQNTAGNFQNFPVPPAQNTGSTYPNPAVPNAYPQGYARNQEYDCRQGQNYRQNEQSNYHYRGSSNNPQQGEYGEFYANQGQQQQQQQQRYGNPSFQTFPQQGSSGYNHQPQGYQQQNQPQNYLGNEQVSTSQTQNYNNPGSHNSEYRAEQNPSSNAYNSSGLYQSQCYPYQDQTRNYSATPNLGSNYPQVGNQAQGSYQNQPNNQQAAGLSTIQEYSTYPTTNSVQGYTAAPNQANQQIYPQNQTQNQGQNYPPPNQQQNQNSSNFLPRNDNQTQNFVRPQSQNQTHDYNADQQQNRNTATNNQTSGYTAPSSHDSAQTQSVGNYPAGTTQITQFKTEDPYWQQNNYSQTNYRQESTSDNYYAGNAANRYQNNYYPPSQQQGFQNQQRYEFNQTTGMDDVKPGARLARNPGQEGAKETNNIPGGQNQISGRVGAQGYTGVDPTRPDLAAPSPQPQSNDRNVVHGLMNPNTTINSLRQNETIKEEERDDLIDKEREDKSEDEILNKDEDKDPKSSPMGKEDPGIPYDWATDLMKGYVPGLISASAKMSIFFCILEEAVRLGDRILAFSQSLFTLNLVEDFLANNSLKHEDGRVEDWAKNVNYYRLDGSTSALEREKLINEFNANPKIHLFLVSTRAGSLGINLVGANRAIVFDASWNPCHDTQAVCRVYRYGQRKPCFVYRLVTDNCLERKIYDRQISKQGMADRVVDQCNPDAHLSLKEAATLSWDWEEDSQVQDFSQTKDGYADPVMHTLLEKHSSLLTKQPFRHESLLVDRKDKKLSQAEKRLARRGYELEKMAATCSRPSYNYVPGNTASRAGGLQIRAIRGGEAGGTTRPVASVRPMQQRGAEGLGTRTVGGSRWIPAEVWQRQGMSAQEMTLPLDVVIPTNSPDKGSIVLKAGQRVMVLKSPKGIYMQLESGKIIAIRTALKLNQQKRDEEPKKGVVSSMSHRKQNAEVGFPLRNNSAISIIPKSSTSPGSGGRPPPLGRPTSGVGFKPFADKEPTRRPRPVATATAKPYSSHVNLTNQVSLSRLPRVKQEPIDSSSLGDNSNSSDSQLRSTEQRVEEVRLEDIVGEAGSNSEYARTDSNRSSNADSESTPQKQSEEKDNRTESYTSDINQDTQTTLQCRMNETREDPSLVSVEQQCQTVNEPAKTSLKNYRHNFPSHKPQIDSSNDDVILEETVPVVQPVLDTINTESVSSTTPRVESDSPKVSENAPQVYPYSQYPGYYDYPDPRAARSLAQPYGTYISGVPPQAGSLRPPPEPAKESRVEPEKPKETRTISTPAIASYQQTVNPRGSEERPSEANNKAKTPVPEPTKPREETHAPAAFSHPTNARYPGPYPPGPYDAYSQHYPAAPGSSTAYTAGAPGYPAFAGPTYDAEYARVYSAFHGPSPAADPYMHRAYPPPPTHPTNYYPPFPHPPPPPYPNYPFLPPYPNPNLPSDPQPPAQ